MITSTAREVIDSLINEFPNITLQQISKTAAKIGGLGMKNIIQSFCFD
jgi:hypothetical protein